jgi:hypothetical protein
MSGLITATRSFDPPAIVDFGSIAEHTFQGGGVFPGLSPGVHAACNSGRGNGSEGNPGQLIDPHNGGRGPGTFPTLADECDPGNSGAKNRGGD